MLGVTLYQASQGDSLNTRALKAAYENEYSAEDIQMKNLLNSIADPTSNYRDYKEDMKIVAKEAADIAKATFDNHITAGYSRKDAFSKAKKESDSHVEKSRKMLRKKYPLIGNQDILKYQTVGKVRKVY